ncbi:MAG: cytochrome C [Dehalococcoidia bacterium]|nr:MAG: cytochrome C [Dehalococcoidia bacterium]
MQVVPFGWRHSNPPVVAEPAWDSPQTRELFVRACADCHSNETKWLWFTNIAPGSWLVANDVYGGRNEMNVSEWVTNNSQNAKRAREAGEVVRDGSMPPLQFLLIHPEARLTDAEKADLAKGLEASLAK